MSTLEFRLGDDICICSPRVITRGGLLNAALIEELAEERGIDPFDAIGREEEIIKDFVTTAIREPYRAVKHCLAPIERFEFEFSDIDDVGGMVTVTATAVFSNDLTHTITVRTYSVYPSWMAFYKLFWLRRPSSINTCAETVYYGVGGDGRIKLYPYVMRETKLTALYRFARLYLPAWRIQEFEGVVTAGLLVPGKFFVDSNFFSLYSFTVLIGDSNVVNVEAPVEFLSDSARRDIEKIEEILRG